MIPCAFWRRFFLDKPPPTLVRDFPLAACLRNTFSLTGAGRAQACHSFFTAMASISTDTFRARPATWTVVRAGGCWGKNSP